MYTIDPNTLQGIVSERMAGNMEKEEMKVNNIKFKEEIFPSSTLEETCNEEGTCTVEDTCTVENTCTAEETCTEENTCTVKETCTVEEKCTVENTCTCLLYTSDAADE